MKNDFKEILTFILEMQQEASDKLKLASSSSLEWYQYKALFDNLGVILAKVIEIQLKEEQT